MVLMRSGEIAPTARTKVRRLPDRGRYDWETIHTILDEGLVCHLGFAVEERPWVIPTTYVRIDDQVYVHGAVGNAALRALADGAEVCVTVTLLDGLVLARSAFHHSMNYRSVMLFGRAVAVDDDQEKYDAMVAIVEHLVPGRTADTRLPSSQELRKTLVVRLALEECSAKVRTGGPLDDEEDMGFGYWAGQLPLSIVPGEPIPDVDAGVPEYLRRWAPTADRVR
jgi:nitroimidazol reductase NimA-like FMN-containing flavoprotein (pyridoxamine 5'-phosphate oxidase superfamily)